MYSKWTDPKNEARLKEAVSSNKSLLGVLRTLGLKPAGGNVSNIKHHIARLDLDVSHHTGQTWSKDVYNIPNPVSVHKTIKRYLVGKFGHKCWQCGLTEWNSLPAPIELDHIDGNNRNNQLDNLRILCSNCHAQTPTFRNSKRD